MSLRSTREGLWQIKQHNQANLRGKAFKTANNSEYDGYQSGSAAMTFNF